MARSRWAAAALLLVATCAAGTAAAAPHHRRTLLAVSPEAAAAARGASGVSYKDLESVAGVVDVKALWKKAGLPPPPPLLCHVGLLGWHCHNTTLNPWDPRSVVAKELTPPMPANASCIICPRGWKGPRGSLAEALLDAPLAQWAKRRITGRGAVAGPPRAPEGPPGALGHGMWDGEALLKSTKGTWQAIGPASKSASAAGPVAAPAPTAASPVAVPSAAAPKAGAAAAAQQKGTFRAASLPPAAAAQRGKAPGTGTTAGAAAAAASGAAKQGGGGRVKTASFTPSAPKPQPRAPPGMA